MHATGGLASSTRLHQCSCLFRENTWAVTQTLRLPHFLAICLITRTSPSVSLLFSSVGKGLKMCGIMCGMACGMARGALLSTRHCRNGCDETLQECILVLETTSSVSHSYRLCAPLGNWPAEGDLGQRCGISSAAHCIATSFTHHLYKTQRCGYSTTLQWCCKSDDCQVRHHSMTDDSQERREWTAAKSPLHGTTSSLAHSETIAHLFLILQPNPAEVPKMLAAGG